MVRLVLAGTDPAYEGLGEAVYDRPTANRSEDGLCLGDLSGIHTGNCGCRMGLPKWLLEKHRGVSKRYLESYVKPFRFIHCHHHYGINGRFLAAPVAILGRYHERQA